MFLKVVFLLWFASLNLGQFAALSKTSFGGVYIFDLLSIFWLLVGGFHLLIVKSRSFKLPKEFLWLLSFAFIALTSLIAAIGVFTNQEIIFSSFYLVRFVSYVMGTVFLYSYLCQGDIKLNFLYGMIALSVVFISIAGYIQLIILPDFSVLDQSLGWDPHKNRLASTFFDPNFTGAYLVLCLNIIISGKEYLKGKFYPLILLAVFSILLTFSRSAWLMLAISIFIWGVFRHPRLLFLSFLLAFSAYFMVPRVQTRISGITDPADSAHFRFISWGKTWEIAKNNLFLGTGFNTFRFVQKDYGFFGVEWGGHSGGGSDSSLLLVMATTGILGILLFVAFFLSSVFDAFKHRKERWSIVLIASYLGLLIESFFINSLFYPQILFLWLVIAVVQAFNLSCK